MRSNKGKILHKYNIITDICEICGVHKRKIPYVGSGYNITLVNHFGYQYSIDGIHWQKEYINCNPKKINYLK